MELLGFVLTSILVGSVSEFVQIAAETATDCPNSYDTKD